MDLNKLPELNFGTITLSTYGVIKVTGPDALSFLHNQLTQDFLNLSTNQARFCSFCNAKGRIQSSFIGLLSEQGDVLLVTSSDLIVQTVKRLSMFVLRSKVKIVDASADYTLSGVIGINDVPKEITPEYWSQFTQKSTESINYWITLYPACGQPRYLRISSLLNPSSNEVSQRISPSNNDTKNEWDLSDILSGVCLIGLPTFESFFPQMINYESLEGVNFKKGCYPGQEVVARSQFRGSIKRRGFIISSVSPLRDGQELFTPNDTSQPCGKIVRAARFNKSYFAFASIQTKADGESHKIVTIDLEEVFIHPLPYALRDDI